LFEFCFNYWHRALKLISSVAGGVSMGLTSATFTRAALPECANSSISAQIPFFFLFLENNQSILHYILLSYYILDINCILFLCFSDKFPSVVWRLFGESRKRVCGFLDELPAMLSQFFFSTIEKEIVRILAPSLAGIL